ncbi:MAG: OprO/OprP family phosphate-selective porin [Flavobacteriaceae bacterium]|jgi:hypothetical protein|nr:OprO/OprP family phosphate-selective porin [Flavobacteriaceae bacterium]
MRKILLVLNCLFSLILSAQQQTDSISENTLKNTSEETLKETPKGTINDPSFKTLLERVIKNDKMLNIMLDTRIDYQAKFNEQETKESSFRGNTLKLWFVGEIAPGFRFRVRQRLNKPQIPMRDNYASSTDHAFLDIDAGKKLTFRVGKQSILFGTFEFDYNAADVYATSIGCNDLDFYKTGISAAYKVANQTLNFQVINSDSPQFTVEKYRSKSLAGIFLWEGSLFNDVIKTRYGYGAFQHDANKYYSWVTVGNQINIQKFTAELDWYMGDRDMNYGDVVQDPELGSRHVRDNAVTVNLTYDLGKVKPILKGTWNKRRDQLNSGSYINGAVQAAVEYYPFTDPLLKNLRFHVMYAYNRTNYNGVYNNLDGVDGHQILAGMRWLVKIK